MLITILASGRKDAVKTVAQIVMWVSDVLVKEKIAVRDDDATSAFFLLIYDLLSERKMWSSFAVLVYPTKYHRHITDLIGHVSMQTRIITAGRNTRGKFDQGLWFFLMLVAVYQHLAG